MKQWELTPLSPGTGAFHATQRFKSKSDVIQAAEQLRDRKQPFIIRDPEGNEWWLTEDGVLKQKKKA